MLNVLGCNFVERSNATRDSVMWMVCAYVIAAILALTVMCMVSLLLITVRCITYELSYYCLEFYKYYYACLGMYLGHRVAQPYLFTC